MPVKAPVPVAAPWSWTGFYIGGHVGGALEISSIADPFGTVSAGDSMRTPTFIGGGQLGANYQIGNVVIGGTADVSWATARGGDNTCFGISGGNFYPSTCTVNPNLFSTFAGRLGYAFGRTLVYAKGGAAWEHNDVSMSVNNNPGDHVLTSATSYGEWGWTLGAGVEHALTPAWSLFAEYNYLDFANRSVATPYTPGNPLPGHPDGPIAGLSNNVQRFNLGLNYRFGANPGIWPADVPLMPLKAPPLASPDWEIVAGSRYMFSSGRAQWESGVRSEGSRLTWSNMNTNSAELFGRIDAPFNVFLSGFVGLGDTVSGRQTDEDFNEDNPHRPYNDTVSSNNGHIAYAVADLGYNVFHGPDYKVGPFVGYTLFNQYIFKYGCMQIANSIGNCVASSPPLASSQLIGLEDMTWQALRVGLSGQVSLTDRIKLAADVAYLPYLSYGWMDDHLEDELQHFMGSRGNGVQLQAVLSYDVTNQLSIGVGGRYWAMWSRDAQFYTVPGGTPAGATSNAIELAGAFVQTAYRFYPDNAAKPGGLPLPFFKAPVASAAFSWTGAYGGIQGGGVWGKSIQIGQTRDRTTFDATPGFDVAGGMIGGTVGYNAQFARRFVYGLEGDMSWVDTHGSARQIAPFDFNVTASTKEDWLSTARARIGVTPVDRWLVYATGGLAVADVEATITPATAFLASESHVRAGWTAGGGIEASITGNWSAKLEYLYVGLENHAYFVPTPNNPLADNRAGGVPLNNNIVRCGINYKIG